MASLLLGLPLLAAYYNVNPSLFYVSLTPYLALTAMITLFLLWRSRKAAKGYPSAELSEKALRELYPGEPPSGRKSFIAAINSKIPASVIVSLVAFTILLFAITRWLVESVYPYPAPAAVNYLGWVYIASLAISSILGFSRFLYSKFTLLRQVLDRKKYAFLATVISVCFATVYSLVVNGLLIVGVNTQGTTPSLSGAYPFVYPPMVPGTLNPLVDLVYMPTGIVQLSYSFNLIIIPFEVVFTALLSLLVGASVAMAHYLISANGLRCTTKGAALSTTGSILGLTATCPTCLVPAFVTAMLYSLGAASTSLSQVATSNIYGVTLPPVLSLATLMLSLVYLSRAIRKNLQPP
jgi:hypothetical protein